MANNDEAGVSSRRALIAEEQARENNEDFWNFYNEPPILGDDVEGCQGDDDVSNSDGDEGADVGDDTTNSGAGDANDTTDGGERTDGSRPKKIRKERSKNKVGAEKQAIIAVSRAGKPLEPSGRARSYDNQVAAILRDNISVYEDNLRDPSQGHLLVILMKKLHERYTFPKKYANENVRGNVVNNYAITKISKALSSWRIMVKVLIQK